MPTVVGVVTAYDPPIADAPARVWVSAFGPLTARASLRLPMLGLGVAVAIAYEHLETGELLMQAVSILGG
jgi:hypothetical protein